MRRRELLVQTSLWAAYGALAKMILRDSLAHANGSAPAFASNYVSLTLNGAPARWTFDQFLKTKASESISASPMITTRLNAAGTDAEYATTGFNGVEVPWLWQSQVAAAGGGQRGITELLNHMIVFRGYGSGVDGHPNNMLKQYVPSATLGSISGYVADESRHLIRALNYPSDFGALTGFRSARGHGLTPVPQLGRTENVLNFMLRPFLKRPHLAGMEALRESHASLVENVGKILNQTMEKDRPGLKTVAADKDAAAKRLKEGFENLESAWTELFGKYINICESTYRDRQASLITDRAIITQDDGITTDSRYAVDSINHANGALAVRIPTPGQDLRNMASTANCTVMAQNFALAEFVLTRKLGCSIELGMREVTELQGHFARQLGSTDVPGQMNFYVINDQHGTGQMPSLYFNSCFFRALAGGLVELVGRLKAEKMFEKTVIHIASDFARAPRSNSAGSDHLFDGMVASVITGRRQGGPLVLGNILRNGSGGVMDPLYSGTMGYKAPVQLGGQTVHLNPGHVASSIGVLLGLPENPWATASAPLLEIEGANVKGKITGDIV